MAQVIRWTRGGEGTYFENQSQKKRIWIWVSGSTASAGNPDLNAHYRKDAIQAKSMRDSIRAKDDT